MSMQALTKRVPSAPICTEIVEAAAVLRDTCKVRRLDREVAEDLLFCEGGSADGSAERTRQRTSGKAKGGLVSVPFRADSALSRACWYSSATRSAILATVPFLRRSARQTVGTCEFREAVEAGRTHDGLLPRDFLRLGEAEVSQCRNAGGSQVGRRGEAFEGRLEARQEREKVR